EGHWQVGPVGLLRTAELVQRLLVLLGAQRVEELVGRRYRTARAGRRPFVLLLLGRDGRCRRQRGAGPPDRQADEQYGSEQGDGLPHAAPGGGRRLPNRLVHGFLLGPRAGRGAVSRCKTGAGTRRPGRRVSSPARCPRTAARVTGALAPFKP